MRCHDIDEPKSLPRGAPGVIPSQRFQPIHIPGTQFRDDLLQLVGLRMTRQYDRGLGGRSNEQCFNVEFTGFTDGGDLLADAN